MTDKGSDRQTGRRKQQKDSRVREKRGKKETERQGRGDMKEWLVGMNESCEDISAGCLRINPTVSGKQSTNTSQPTAELPVLRQLKGNIIKMQMWPIY